MGKHGAVLWKSRGSWAPRHSAALDYSEIYGAVGVRRKLAASAASPVPLTKNISWRVALSTLSLIPCGQSVFSFPLGVRNMHCGLHAPAFFLLRHMKYLPFVIPRCANRGNWRTFRPSEGALLGMRPFLGNGDIVFCSTGGAFLEIGAFWPMGNGATPGKSGFWFFNFFSASKTPPLLGQLMKSEETIMPSGALNYGPLSFLQVNGRFCVSCLLLRPGESQWPPFVLPPRS